MSVDMVSVSLYNTGESPKPKHRKIKAWRISFFNFWPENGSLMDESKICNPTYPIKKQKLANRIYFSSSKIFNIYIPRRQVEAVKPKISSQLAFPLSNET